MVKFRALDLVGCWATVSPGDHFTGVQSQGSEKMQAAVSTGDICLGSTGLEKVFSGQGGCVNILNKAYRRRSAVQVQYQCHHLEDIC